MSWLSCEMILKNSVCGGPSLLDVNNVESWEKIFANKATNRRLISKIYKRFMKLDINKTGLPWWLHGQRIHLPMQKTQVRSLVQEDPTCCRATKPVRHNYWAYALRAPELQLLRPKCLKPLLSNKRSLHNEKPEHRSQTLTLQLEKSQGSNKDPAQPK